LRQSVVEVRGSSFLFISANHGTRNLNIGYRLTPFPQVAFFERRIPKREIRVEDLEQPALDADGAVALPRRYVRENTGALEQFVVAASAPLLCYVARYLSKPFKYCL
jgi:hypothetical protein